jgi:ATP-dependent Clp protease protease subunit
MPRQRRSKLDPLSRIMTLGDIETDIVNELIHNIYEINEEDAKKQTADPIKLIINSAGGEIYSGLALIDVINTSLTPIHTICHGSAMSMGLIVFVAGHYRTASPNATFMYHEAMYGLEGKTAYHRQEMKEANRIDKICDDYLLSRTKLTQKLLDNVKNTQAEWYFDAKTALKYDVVNEIL